MKQLPIFKNALTTGLSWGLTGGTILIILISFHGNRPNHPLEISGLLLFAFFIIASVLTVQPSKKVNEYVRLFMTSFLTFVLIMLMLYSYKYFSVRQRSGFMWHNFFIMTAIGAFLCSILTFFVSRLIKTNRTNATGGNNGLP